MEQDIIKVKDDEKICPHCGQNHGIEDIDLEQAAEDFADAFFGEVWGQGKEELKEMSKKEIAEQMYFLGAFHYMKSLEAFAGHFFDEIDKKIISKNRKS